MADEKSTTGSTAAPAAPKVQGAGQPAKAGEAKTTQPAETAQDVPITGSPGGVYRIEDGKRVRVQD